MKKLDIAISKATLKSFTVILDEKEPAVSATIALLTEGGKEITEYRVSTTSWNDKDKFDLPINAIEPIIKIAQILETVVVSHCRDSQKALESSVSQTFVPDKEVVTSIQYGKSEPIDITVAPF